MFFITTSKMKALMVKEDYEKVYKAINISEYFEIFVISTAYFDKNVIMKDFSGNVVLIYGTIFDECLFNEELLERYDDFLEFVKDLKSDKQILFGHYVVIIINEAKRCVEIITDRVGLINTYYTIDKEGEVYISDDLLEVSKASGNVELYNQAVYEFLLTESNVGKASIFKNVFRLGFGKQLYLQDRTLHENNIYEYRIEKLTKEEYIKRVEKYFKCFNNFSGKIATDLSAGYDTRLINAIAHKTIGWFEGFNNTNDKDGGCDREISSIIAQRLGIKLHTVDYSNSRKCDKKDYLMLLREATALRDAKRSQRLTILMEEKYKNCDLALGGYGGEVVRAKYNKYTDIKDFVFNYYHGSEAEKVCGFKHYCDNLENELKEYRMPDNLEHELIQNWYYAVAKMRIWGSGFIHFSFSYGNVVHPFMDWYLLNPLFGFKKEELLDARLQLELIALFAPELSDLPINARMERTKKELTLKEKVNKRISSAIKMSAFWNCIYCSYRNIKERRSTSLEKGIPEELLKNSELNTKRILLNNGKVIEQRMKTVINAYKYAKSDLEVC